MPIRIPDTLPARQILEGENVFVMSETRALQQDIRPLKILILNLMPVKITTETQLLRVLSNTPLQVDVEFLMTSSHESKHTSHQHLSTFYKSFDEVRHQKYDGMIITGAPVEHIKFEDVDYWPEMTEIMAWSKTNVTNTFHICWGAQAGLYYHYGIEKYPTRKKMFGIFPHKVVDRKEPLMRGFDDVFFAPHSRHTTILRDDIAKCPDLRLLAESKDAGVYIVISADRRQIFVTGHSEYDRNTLKDEYVRDKNKGLEIDMPANYFPDNNINSIPQVIWRAHANLLYSNWLNYYVYQATPYSLDEI
ncbi:MAG: homoserine O-succinyltransferase [Bacteroidales bacterium]|nr:homoserine O-succinyltransferase [Bacteroidales bacterium]